MDNINTDTTSPEWVLNLKASIRPVLTYVFTLLYVYIFFKKDDMPDLYISGINNIMIVIIIFWFGERLIRNTGITDFLLNYGKSSAPKDEAK